MASVSSVLQGKDTTRVFPMLEGPTGASLTSNPSKRWVRFYTSRQSSSCSSTSHTCCFSCTLCTSSSSPTSSSPCASPWRGIGWRNVYGAPPSCLRHSTKLEPLPAPQLPLGQVFPSSSSALAPAPGPLTYVAKSIIIARRRRRQCEAIRTPNAVTAPAAAAASSSFCPNTTAVAAAAPPPVQVIRLPAAATENAAEDVCTAGTLSRTLVALVRVQEERLLFRPSVFNASKLRVLRLGKNDDDRPLQHPRIYTLTHSDLTAKITLAVAREINKAQVMGWYNKLQRDEVLAEWRRAQGEMSLHVHCHISGSNFLHMVAAKLRFFIFQKELPLVLEAFMHGDRDLFKRHPELQRASVWVYFHSNVVNYNRVECWGPLCDAMKKGVQNQVQGLRGANNDVLKTVGKAEEKFAGAVSCLAPCECCSPHATVIPIPESLSRSLQKTTLSQ